MVYNSGMDLNFSKTRVAQTIGALLFFLAFTTSALLVFKYIMVGAGILLISYTEEFNWKRYLFSVSKVIFVLTSFVLFLLLIMMQGEMPFSVKILPLLILITIFSFSVGRLVRGYEPPLQLSQKTFLILDVIIPLTLMVCSVLFTLLLFFVFN